MEVVKDELAIAVVTFLISIYVSVVVGENRWVDT